MNKGELIKFLEPYTDDLEIVISLASRKELDVSFNPISEVYYGFAEKISLPLPDNKKLEYWVKNGSTRHNEGVMILRVDKL